MSREPSTARGRRRLADRRLGSSATVGLETFVAEHYDRLLRLAWLVCRDGSDAGDAVQVALEQAWQRQTTLRDDASLRPWLDRIVVREAGRIAKRRRGLMARFFTPRAEVGWIEQADHRIGDRDDRMALRAASTACRPTTGPSSRSTFTPATRSPRRPISSARRSRPCVRGSASQRNYLRHELGEDHPMTGNTFDPMNDERTEREIRRFLEWDVEGIPGAPSEADMVQRLHRAHRPGGIRRGFSQGTPAFRVVVVLGLLAALAAGALAVGALLNQHNPIVPPRTVTMTVAGTEDGGASLRRASTPVGLVSRRVHGRSGDDRPERPAGFFLSVVDNTYEDPCAHVERSPKIGPSVGAVAAALGEIPGTTATRPVLRRSAATKRPR